jgi:hypothetical protein
VGDAERSHENPLSECQVPEVRSMYSQIQVPQVPVSFLKIIVEDGRRREKLKSYIIIIIIIIIC